VGGGAALDGKFRPEPATPKFWKGGVANKSKNRSNGQKKRSSWGGFERREGTDKPPQAAGIQGRHRLGGITHRFAGFKYSTGVGVHGDVGGGEGFWLET